MVEVVDVGQKGKGMWWWQVEARGVNEGCARCRRRKAGAEDGVFGRGKVTGGKGCK